MGPLYAELEFRKQVDFRPFFDFIRRFVQERIDQARELLAAFFGIVALTAANTARADALDDIMKLKVIKVAVPQDDPKRLVLPIDSLRPGRYTVKYRALSMDGHAVTGEYGFSVGPER